MSFEQEKMIVGSLPSLYPLQKFEEEAINALVSLPIDGDVISCKAAIDYFVTNVGFHDEDGCPIEDECELREIWTGYFDGIPPAQPEITHEQAVGYLQSTGWMQSHDLQMMLDGIHKFTAQSERIRGHWIPVGGALYQCDQCGVVSLKRKFCSECGADMREVTE